MAEGIVALCVAFNFVSCGKKTKTEATVLSLGISADDEAAEADMGNIVPFENIRITEVLKTIRRVLKTSGGGTNNP